MAATARKVKILIDYRETKLLGCLEESAAARWDPDETVLVERRNLVLGDVWIVVSGQSTSEEEELVVLYERKTVSDLLASIKDGRYEEQSHRLSHSNLLRQPHQAVYLLEGVLPHTRHHDMRMIYSAMTSLNIYKGFSIMRSVNVNETADYLMAQATKIAKENRESRPRTPWAWTVVAPSPPPPPPHLLDITASNTTTTTTTSTTSVTTSSPPSLVQGMEDGRGQRRAGEGDVIGGGKRVTAQDYCDVVKKVKKENITRDNIEIIMLSQVPGISTRTAKALLDEFGSLSQLRNAIHERPHEILRCKLPCTEQPSSPVEGECEDEGEVEGEDEGGEEGGEEVENDVTKSDSTLDRVAQEKTGKTKRLEDSNAGGLETLADEGKGVKPKTKSKPPVKRRKLNSNVVSQLFAFF